MTPTTDTYTTDDTVPHMPGSYVLVVDDEAVVRDFMARCLERAGYIVKHAASSEAAVAEMIAEPASVVLCDIRMPGLDGLWLAEQLHDRWPDTPVIMATGIDDLQTIRQSRALGAVNYLTKPIAPAHLVDTVRQAIASAELTEELTAKLARAAKPAPAEPSDEIVTHDLTEQDGVDDGRLALDHPEAEYELESPVKCPACGERIASLKAVRLVRSQVNFTSTLPRRGRVIVCPNCLAIVPAELTNF